MMKILLSTLLLATLGSIVADVVETANSTMEIGDYVMKIELLKEFEYSQHFATTDYWWKVAAAQFRGRLYFALGHETGASGLRDSELWQSDGTSQGTKQTIPAILHPRHFANVNDTMLFIVSYESESGDPKRLWVIGEDHTINLVREFHSTEVLYDDMRDLGVFGNNVIFSVGNEPWISDGKNTQPVKDVNSVVGNAPRGFTEYKDEFYYADYDEDVGYELWASDGTSKGTRLVKDIASGFDIRRNTTYPQGSMVLGFVVLGDSLLFSANDEIHGRELWVTNGTSEGTRLLCDINPDAGSGSSPEYWTFEEYHGRLHFVAAGQHWVTDGSTCELFLDGLGSTFTRARDKLFYEKEGTLFVTDGTLNGTLDLSEVNYHEGVTEITPIQNLVFFQASNGWPTLYPATTGPTSGAPTLSPTIPTSLTDQTSQQSSLTYYGRELWVSDGTLEGTRIVMDILPGPRDTGSLEYSYQDLLVLDDMLLFTAWNGTEWKRNFYKLALERKLQAFCQDVNITVGKNCATSVDPEQVNNGSTGGNLTFVLNVTSFNGIGNFPVTLTVSDASGETKACTAMITINGECPGGDNDNNDDDDDVNAWLIVASVIGGLCLLALFAGILAWRKNRSHQTTAPPHEQAPDSSQHGAAEISKTEDECNEQV